jgi:hypothetical protein
MRMRGYLDFKGTHNMEDATVQLILSRFDKLDDKLDKAIAANAALDTRVTKIETTHKILYTCAIAIGGLISTVLHFFFPAGIKR